MSANGNCPNCGGYLFGDGFQTVVHCENADQTTVWETEPDADPVFCRRNPEDVSTHD